MRMRIKSQLYSDAEAQKKVGAVLDDCGPSSEEERLARLAQSMLDGVGKPEK